MKPTQEQVVAWAREARFYENEIADDIQWFTILATLAYEAGRKDENEACAVIAFNAKTYIEAAACDPRKERTMKPVAWIKIRELSYMKAVVEHGKDDWQTNLGLKPEPDDEGLYTETQVQRMIELLERCENEMRYAGWTKFESDNPARNGVYEDVKEFLK